MGLPVFCSDHSAAENRRCQRKAIIEERATRPTISDAWRVQVRPSSFGSNSLRRLPLLRFPPLYNTQPAFSKTLSML